MLHVFLVSIHVLVSFILISMVLVQKGKGADIGAAFGGASNTVFGPRGAQSFLSKLTTGAAIIFMLTSLTLAFTTARQKSSIMEGVKPLTQTEPAAPLAPPVPAEPAPAK